MFSPPVPPLSSLAEPTFGGRQHSHELLQRSFRIAEHGPAKACLIPNVGEIRVLGQDTTQIQKGQGVLIPFACGLSPREELAYTRGKAAPVPTTRREPGFNS
jgi:hypothetical protein